MSQWADLLKRKAAELQQRQPAEPSVQAPAPEPVAEWVTIAGKRFVIFAATSQERIDALRDVQFYDPEKILPMWREMIERRSKP